MFIFKKKKEEAKIIKLGDSGFVISIPQGVISKPEEPPLTNKSWIQRLEEDLKEDLDDLEDDQEAAFNEWLEADSKESDYDKRLIKEIETGWLEIQKTEADLIKVRSAWNNPGRAPGYHRKMQQKLRKEWPVLAAALDRL